MSIKSFSDFLTEDTKEISFVFGRFNPPTNGHEKLFNHLKFKIISYFLILKKMINTFFIIINFKYEIPIFSFIDTIYNI